MTKIISLAGSSGSGKSTVASGLFYLMKMAHLNVELCSEWVKEAVWEDRKAVFQDQLYITAKQNHRLKSIDGQTNYIVTDSPIFLGGIYAPDDYFPSYNKFLLEVFKSYDNEVFYLERVKPYVQVGRIHTEEESKQIGKKILKYMDENEIKYTSLPADENAAKLIFNMVTGIKKCKICDRELEIEKDVYINDGVCNCCQIS